MLTLEEKMKDMGLIDNNANEAISRRIKVISIKCFDKEEAEFCTKYAEMKYPQLVFICTWADFNVS